MIKIFELLSVDRIKILNKAEKNEALKEICRMLATADTINEFVEMIE